MLCYASRHETTPAQSPAAGPAHSQLLAFAAWRPPDRRAVAAVAHLVGAVAGRRWHPTMAAVGNFHCRCLAHPLRRLRDQRLRRSLARWPGKTHPQQAAGDRRGKRARSTDRVCGVDDSGIRTGAADQSPDRAAERGRRVSRCQLSLPETSHLPAAGLSRGRVRLEYSDGLCRGHRLCAGNRLAVVPGQHSVGHRLRHLVRDGGSRRRPACWRQKHGDFVWLG